MKSLFGKRIPPDHSSSVVTHPTLPPNLAEEVERIFKELSDDQSEAFVASQKIREVDFLRAESVRTGIQEARLKEFSCLIDSLAKSFQESQSRHGSTFDAAVRKYDETIRMGTKTRDDAFEKGLVRRDEAFASAQRGRQASAEYHAQGWVVIFERGQKARDERAKRILSVLENLFESFINEERVAFDNAQRCRDATWKGSFNTATPNRMADNSSSPKSSLGDDEFSVGSSPPVVTRTPLRSSSDETLSLSSSNRPAQSVELTSAGLCCVTPATASPPEKGPLPLKPLHEPPLPPSTPPEPPASRPHALISEEIQIISEATSPGQSPTGTALQSPRSSSMLLSNTTAFQRIKGIRSTYGAVFAIKLDKWNSLFVEEQQSWARAIESAEEERSRVDSIHDLEGQISDILESQNTTFTRLLDSMYDVFASKETICHQAELLQARIDSDQQSLQAMAFSFQLDWDQSRYTADQKIWTSTALALRENSEELLSTMLYKVLTNLASQNKLFEEVCMAKRMEVESMQHEMATERMSREREQIEREMEQLRRQMERERMELQSEQAWLRGHRRRSSPKSPITAMRETSFSFATLLPNIRGGWMNFLTLFTPTRPISDVEVPQDVEPYEAVFITNDIVEEHRLEFESMQGNHLQRFEALMEQQQNAFLLNDGKRQEAFNSFLQHSQHRFDVQSQQHLSRFSDVQEIRDKGFWQAEVNRGLKFLEDERLRELEYEERERARVKHFKEVQASHLEDALEEEKNRQAEFISWESAFLLKMETKIEEMRKKFEGQREVHKAEFGRLFSWACLQKKRMLDSL